MIKRSAEEELKALSIQFKAVALTGPRQSGKTTLVKKTFPDKAYVSLENPDMRSYAINDPRGFLSNYPNGAILDEVQRTPALFSYLQQVLDESNQNGLFILTGSNNFLLQESISQSLAGRIGYLTLLPLSLKEIGGLEGNINQLIFKGGYPVLYASNTDPAKWFRNYIATYIERDVRQLKNIVDLTIFERFIRLCAGRTGQLLNMNSLSLETGVDQKTVASWLSVLETSFILFRLQPYYKSYNKRIIKMPKLYFYDTGLAAALLGFDEAGMLEMHPFKGSLFENLVVTEFLKQRFNKGLSNNVYFWRDSTGNEIDLIIDKGQSLLPIEIKSGMTVTTDYFKGLNFWNKLTGSQDGIVIYAGDSQQTRSNGIKVIPLKDMDSIVPY
ncbi:MAG: ATP-binding protein [Omnitrophica WOR_2 bacterium]|jgi:predicted AAA+ superfamily ATPase